MVCVRVLRKIVAAIPRVDVHALRGCLFRWAWAFRLLARYGDDVARLTTAAQYHDLSCFYATCPL